MTSCNKKEYAENTLFIIIISSIMEIDGKTYLVVILLNGQIRSNYEMTFKLWKYLELICLVHFHHNRALEVSTGIKRPPYREVT